VDEKAAIERAREASRQEGRNLEDFDEPSAVFVDGEWQVAFSGKVRAPGNHFLVIINDDTGDVIIFPGHLAGWAAAHGAGVASCGVVNLSARSLDEARPGLAQNLTRRAKCHRGARGWRPS